LRVLQTAKTLRILSSGQFDGSIFDADVTIPSSRFSY
jgi:hypothetical protein